MAAGDDKSREQALLDELPRIFSPYFKDSVAVNLQVVSNYYSFLADGIDYQKYTITAPVELLEQFESVYLWLRDQLKTFPANISKQVDAIFDDARLCSLMGTVLVLTDGLMRPLPRPSILRYLSPFTRFFGFGPLPTETEMLLDAQSLLDAKMSLKRLSQILKFAASIEPDYHDNAYSDLKEHYDPDLVNKQKLFALVSILRVQLQNSPDDQQTGLILQKLDSLEAELKRPKVRWSIVITGFFVLFSFMADLKSLAPDFYDGPLKTVESILNTLHSEGSVQSSNALRLPPPFQQDKPVEESASHDAILPEEIRIKSEEDGEEVSTTLSQPCHLNDTAPD